MVRVMRVTAFGWLLLMMSAAGCQNPGKVTGSPADSGPDKPLSFNLDAQASYGDGCVRATAAACSSGSARSSIAC